MDPKLRSSFIPKKPMPIQGGQKRKPYRHFDLLSFVGTIFFLVALAGAAWVFFVDRSLNLSIDKKGEELQTISQSFDFGKVGEYERFSERLRVVDNLLYEHTIITNLFTTLGERTLHDVEIDSIEFAESSDEVNPLPYIEIIGTAASFNALTVQSDELRRDSMFTQISFDEIRGGGDVDQFGIGFVLTARIGTGTLSYVPSDDIEEVQESVATEEVAEEDEEDTSEIDNE